MTHTHDGSRDQSVEEILLLDAVHTFKAKIQEFCSDFQTGVVAESLCPSADFIS